MSEPSGRQVTEGARALRSYLEETRQSLLAFCRAAGLDYAWVYRQVSGERGQRVSVDFAKAIFDATAGAIPIESWSSGTLKPVEEFAHGSNAEAP